MISYLTHNLKKRRRVLGFTVVEFLVTAAVFSVIVVGAGGIFIEVLKIQRRGIEAQKIQENIQFVLDTISKEIRVSQVVGGQDTDCITTFASSLDIIHPESGSITYGMTSGVVQRTGGGATTNLTGSDVEFSRFAFCIQYSDIDDKQARVTILAQARPLFGISDPALIFDIQTTLSSRDLTVELQN